MGITKEQFAAYVKVQRSGVTNMLDAQTVSGLSGLTTDQVWFIIKFYKELVVLYPFCETCGAFEEPKMKWNSGNPMEIMFPTCTCQEDATNAELDRRWGKLDDSR